MENRGAQYDVLFLGSGNSARSLMAEAILNREGVGRFCAYSAGVNASIEPDQNAINVLKSMQFDVRVMRSKNWNEVAGEAGPTFDFIFTVSEEALLLPQSIWKGHPAFAHWGVPDPARAEGNDALIRLAYADAFRMLSKRIGIFVNLPLRSLDLLSVQRRLDTIGKPSLSVSNVSDPLQGWDGRSSAYRSNKSVA
jgi:arsenate reductase